MIAHTHLGGMIAAVFTSFTKEDEVDLEMINHYVGWATSTTIRGVSVCDTTGEFSSLTIEERQQISAWWIEASKHRFKVTAHVGSNCQKDFAQLARRAVARHTDVTVSTTSSSFEPGTVDDLVNYFKPVCEIAPGTPFYYYDMSSITGVDLPVSKFLTRGSKVIPNLVGVKFAHNDLMKMQQYMNLENRLFEILSGFDEILIVGISIGAIAGVGSTYNYISSVYQHVFGVIHKNNMAGARQWQLKSVEMVKLIIRYGNGVCGEKAITSLVGIDCGNCRLPLPIYTEDGLACIRKGWEHPGIRP